MQVTIEQLKTWYKEYSANVFKGEMPDVTFVLTMTRSYLGRAQRKGTTYIISVSNFFDRNENGYRNTLLHEMCHVWCFYHGYRNEHHTGQHWLEIVSVVYHKTGMSITRTAKDEELKAANNGNSAIVVDLDYGTCHFIIKTTKNVIWRASDGNKIGGHVGQRLKGIYITDSPKILAAPSSRSLKRGYKYSNSEYERLIKPILASGIKVNDICSLCFLGKYDYFGVK